MTPHLNYASLDPRDSRDSISVIEGIVGGFTDKERGVRSTVPPCFRVFSYDIFLEIPIAIHNQSIRGSIYILETYCEMAMRSGKAGSGVRESQRNGEGRWSERVIDEHSHSSECRFQSNELRPRHYAERCLEQIVPICHLIS